MTRVELADGIILLMGYNSQDKKLDRRLVWFVADRVMPQLIDNYAKTYGFGIDEALENFITVKESELKYNSRRKQRYADIPTPALTFPGYSTIRQIGDIQDETTTFVAVKNGQQAIISNLEVGGLGGRIGYRLEQNRIWFVNIPDGVYTHVLVKYVPTISGVSDSEQLAIPSVIEGDLINLIMQVLREQKITPEDKNSNNVSN
jgi:hypothetical protein